MIAGGGAPGGVGPEDPEEHGSSLGVRNGGAPASINSLVTGNGDNSFNLIWSYASTN